MTALQPIAGVERLDRVGGVDHCCLWLAAITKARQAKSVTGEGEEGHLLGGQQRRLFNAVRAGLGQVGVITKATLKLVAAPESAA